MSNSDSERERIFYLDILRIAASFFVVILHVAAGYWYSTDINSAEWSIMNAYDSIARWCVPVFVMISGALFLNRDIPVKVIWKKYIFRIITAYLAWSFVYSFIFNYLAGKGFQAFIDSLITGHFHLWFLFMIVGLYAITPFLRKIAENKKLGGYFLLLAFIFAVCIPEIIRSVNVFSAQCGGWIKSIVDQTNLKFVLGYPVYYMAGHYIHNTVLKKKTERTIYILGAAGFLFTAIATLLVSRYMNEAQEIFYGYLTLNVFLESICVFTIGKNLIGKIKPSERALKIVSRFSEYTFGAYLVHVLILRVLNKFCDLNSLTCSPLIAIPLTAIAAYIISYAISAVLNQIPVVKKYLA